VIAEGARALVSFGLAGGLAPDARPGRLLLPRRVLTSSEQVFDVDVRWHARLTETLAADFDFDDRPLFAAHDVLADPAAKRRAAALGVAAVDLESGAIAAAAAQANVPFVVVRAVADGLDDALPSGVSGWVAEDGETRVAHVAAAALVPSNWPLLWVLARRYGTARRTLERAAQRLAHEDFLFQ
jgi:adenosylhomocysteine nucleosidase